MPLLYPSEKMILYRRYIRCHHSGSSSTLHPEVLLRQPRGTSLRGEDEGEENGVPPTMAFTIVEFERDNMANVYLQMEGMLPFFFT
jgi:hypothetical protein